MSRRSVEELATRSPLGRHEGARLSPDLGGPGPGPRGPGPALLAEVPRWRRNPMRRGLPNGWTNTTRTFRRYVSADPISSAEDRTAMNSTPQDRSPEGTL